MMNKVSDKFSLLSDFVCVCSYMPQGHEGRFSFDTISLCFMKLIETNSVTESDVLGGNTDATFSPVRRGHHHETCTLQQPAQFAAICLHSLVLSRTCALPGTLGEGAQTSISNQGNPSSSARPPLVLQMTPGHGQVSLLAALTVHAWAVRMLLLVDCFAMLLLYACFLCRLFTGVRWTCCG
jgi:hypothetical protein